MLTAWPTIVDQDRFPQIYDFAEKNTALAKNLYNAALFRLRQVFCGWDKTSRTDNEKEVFGEIETVRQAYPKLKVKRVLSYTILEKIMRITGNPDFFSGLPMQTAQAVVRKACDDFRSWLKALKDYKKNPSRYLGKPRMPKYCKSARKSFEVTNQDAVLYRSSTTSSSAVIKFPGISKQEKVMISGLPSYEDLRQVTVKPYYGKYILTYVFENGAPPCYPDLPEMAGVDFGTGNIAALACTDGSSVVFNGGVVKSRNQLFAKKRAAAVSSITKGTYWKHAQSKHLDLLSIKHDCQTRDSLHKISTAIVRWCIAHRVGVLVLGVNRFWKQKADMGKRNNQSFVNIPHARLRWMITYKALIAGIDVIEQEESYISKADATVDDPMPVYGKEEGRPVFSGKRIQRGLYKTASGLILNADCNGAANILRKAVPGAWKNTKDFKFLACPESVGYWVLNPKYKQTA